MGNNKYYYLVKNIGVLTLSNFASKILSFFLIPLYTNILTASEYGVYDMVSTTVLLLIPILTFNIEEPVMRFAMERGVDRSHVFTIGIEYLLKSYIIVLTVLILNKLFRIVPLTNSQMIFFFLFYVVNALSGIVFCFARGLGMMTDVAISSIITTVIVIVSNIVCLVYLSLGLTGYFIATILGTLIQSIYLLVRIRYWEFYRPRERDIQLKQEMLSYGKPMIANSVSWWINSMSDRYVVVWFCGIAENGIYSVASKIPLILNILQSIFNQAWVLSAVQEYDEEDGEGFFSNVYNQYSALMVIMCSVLIVADRPLAKFLYAKEFYVAWRYVPFLLIAIVFGAMSGYLGGIFSAVKQAKSSARSTMIGAAANIVLNVLLVPLFGALGAAIATAVAYLIVWIIRIYYAQKYMKLEIHIKRDGIAYFILLVQSFFILAFEENSVAIYAVLSILFVGIIILYHKVLAGVFEVIWIRLRKSE